MSRRVAVIGGGSSGLSTIKCCLDEGLEPVCFESSDDIGGVWRFHETPEPGRSSVYRALIANTSKEMMCYSNFPMPAHYPNYMHHSLLLQYLKLYAEQFDLLKHIHLQTKVCSVKQRPDFSHSGQWEVVTENRDGHKETHVFDAVCVCSGQFTYPTMPLSAFPGIDTFPGHCSHSWEFKDPEPFCGKRVVVIGLGNSGGDLAVEISKVAKMTFLSTREGAWFMGRMSSGGLPSDMVVVRRCSYLLLQLFPLALLNWIMESYFNQKFNHQLYGLQPRHRILQQRPVINDDLPTRILQGLVQVKPDIKEFQGSTVVFDNGAVEEDIDAVVFCTGYKATFPFLPPLHTGPEGELTLFRRVFPVYLEHSTLAIMAFLNPTGPVMPLVEMQARWAARIFSGRKHLPPVAKMQKIMQNERKQKIKRYRNVERATLETDYIPYVDSIAQEIGVRPNVLWLFLTDPKLGWTVFFGPCTPFQYRLNGPGRWVGARQAILTQWERVAQPFKTRPIPEPKSSGLYRWMGLAGGAGLLLIFYGLHRKNPNLFQNQITWIASIVATAKK